MKKMLKRLSIVLFAAACLVPATAWAAGSMSVELQGDGALKATDTAEVRSVLVEVELSGDEVAKVTGVVLKDAPQNALATASYSADTKKATIAVSSGNAPLDLQDASLGTIDVIAQDASGEHPVPVEARVVSLIYIDEADSAAATENGTFDPSAVVRLASTEAKPPTNDGSNGNNGDGSGNGSNNGNGDGNGSGSSMGNGTGNGNGNGNGSNQGASDLKDGNPNVNNGSTTNTADYRPKGVVTSTKTGQNTADASLVRTGDVMLICIIALAASAVAVFIALTISRRKRSAKKRS